MANIYDQFDQRGKPTPDTASAPASQPPTTAVNPYDQFDQSRRSPPAAPDEGTRLGALMTGERQVPGDIGWGLAQLEAHLDPFQMLFPKHRDWVDRHVAEREKTYETDPTVQAHPGYARAGRTIGDVGAAGVVAAPVLAAGAPTTLLGTAAYGALTSGLAELPQPVPKGGYWSEKLTDVGVSTVEGGILAPVFHAAASGLKWLFAPSAQRAARTAATQQKASALIGGAFAEAEKGGGPSAIDVMDMMMRARSTGQPYVLLDIPNVRPVDRLAGTAYRGPRGAAATHMQEFQEERMGKIADSDALDHAMQRTVQGKRLGEWIDSHIASGSARDEAKALRLQRAANARPLWGRAMEGGSLAPLEHQFTVAFNEASQAEANVVQQLAQARSKLTPALGKQATSWDVYSTSAANRAEQAASQEVARVEQELARIRQVKEDIRTRLQQAQADGSANAKGAVWSPRLQEFLDSPEGRIGLREGMKLERQNALAEGRPINATEYAIVGTDEAGDPIVGKVPNMRVLQMVKQGLDVQWQQLATYDAFGRLQMTKPLQAIGNIRRALVTEMDRLNPDYAAARAQWSGDTASREALEAGQRAFNPRAMTAEEFAELWQGMTPGDREFFKVGVADTMRRNIARVGGGGEPAVTGDAAKTLLRNPEDRQKLAMMFPNPAEFDEFAGYINRERAMFGTGVDIMKGSPTAERQAGDEAIREGIGAAHETSRLLTHGDPFAALSLGGRLRRGMAKLPGPQSRLDLEVMKQLTDPDIPRRVLPSGELQVGAPPPPPGVPWASYLGGISPYVLTRDPGYDAIMQGQR